MGRYLVVLARRKRTNRRREIEVEDGEKEEAVEFLCVCVCVFKLLEKRQKNKACAEYYEATKKINAEEDVSSFLHKKKMSLSLSNYVHRSARYVRV